jgi:iron complex outermembrane receptor protein
VQARYDRQDQWGGVATGAVGGAWRPAPGWRLRAHWGQSFRAPSYTELYYTSPSRVGSPELGPERANAAEVGVQWRALAVSVFERRARCLIDFVRDDADVWRATNLGRVRTRGAEAALLLPAAGPARWQRLGIVWLDSEVAVDPARSAYALAHPELEAVWSGAVDLGRGFGGGWAARFRDPAAAGSWATLDLRLTRRILGGVSLTVEAANVLDRHVTELAGVPLPGRWVSLTAAWREAAP